MPRIMINCSKTGEVVPTGMATDQHSWSRLAANWAGDPFRCPACDTTHAWMKSDAILIGRIMDEHRR